MYSFKQKVKTNNLKPFQENIYTFLFQIFTINEYLFKQRYKSLCTLHLLIYLKQSILYNANIYRLIYHLRDKILVSIGNN